MTQHEQNRERRREIFEKINGEFELPSPSGTVMQVIRLCNSETSSLEELADLIQTDPALTVEIIKYANSAFMSTGLQVASVHKATVKLGLQTVTALALGFSLLANNRSGTCKQFNYPLFWRTSLAKALAAREVAKLNKGINANDLFICGLLSNIGRLSFATIYPEQYGELLEGNHSEAELKRLELEAFGIDSDELTSELFIAWGLPVHYALAAGFHHDLGYVELGEGTIFHTAVILHLADMISKMCQSRKAQPELFEAVINISKKYQMDLGEFTETFKTIVESWHEHGTLFDITTKDCYLYDTK